MRRIRVLSVDDYAPLRVYLRTIFDLEDEIELVGEAENGAQAIEEARRLRPDVIIMDVDMPVLDGLEATRQILREQPQAKVVFLVAEVTWRTEAQAVGASAFLLKDTPPDELVATVLAQVRAPVAPKPVAVPAGPRAAPVWASLWQRLSLLGRASSQATADAWTSVRRWLVQEQWPRLKDPSFQRSFRRTLVLVAGLAAAVAIARTVDVAALARQITLGGAFSFISLFFGVFFFVYAARYYASIALILAIGGNGNGRNGNGYPNGNGNGLRRNGFVNSLRRRIANGLQNHNGNDNGNGNGFHLDRQPFVSIHLPTYNEQRVIDRLLTACTSFDYENYEVIVADDSADGTLDRLGEWAKHPKVKVSHRINRKGFKGAALKKTMEIIDPRTEFVIIYDADFVPGPDMIQQYLAYFYGPNGANGNHNGGKGHPSSGNGGNNGLADEKVAAVQGYQWHMLNADENWITKGVRAEYSGSYVVERSGQELVGTMKMISGSVYMIRADVLRQIGWGTSITEDWELTIKLYLAGYKVLYTPFIQAPAECVNSFKQLVKQRMRWAEGHTYQVKKYFRQVMTSPKLSLREKLEFLYYAPYYLQSVFFIVGTLLWLLTDTFLHDYFPYWRSLFGWSLVFTNAASLALMNLAGLFLERGVKRDLGGILSVVLLGYLLAPFQAYAAVKGLLEKEEGGWNRTPKSGRITGGLAKLQLARRLRWLLGAQRRRPRPRPQGAGAHFKLLAAEFWPRRWRSGLAYGTLAFLLAALLLVMFQARNVTPVAAAPDVFNLHKDFDCLTTGTPCTMDGTTGTAGSLLFDDATDDFTWSSTTSYPTGGDPGEIAQGDYIVTVYFSLSKVPSNKTIDLEFSLTYGATTIGTVTEQFAGGAASPRNVTIASNYGPLTLDENPAQPLRLRIRFVSNTFGQTLTMYFDDPGVTGQTVLNTPTITVDELGWRLLLLVPLVPAVPLLLRALRRRKARSRWNPFALSLSKGEKRVFQQTVGGRPEGRPYRALRRPKTRRSGA